MADSKPAPSREFVLGYCDMMLDGVTREMHTTKKVIAAVPDASGDYRPDPKARTAKELAWHLASVDVQFLDEIADMKFSMEPRYKNEEPKTSAELATWYEKNFTRAAERVRGMTAEQLMTPLDFYGAFTFPAAFYLGFLNNHSIHHRGQLSTYLRPMGSKVPSIYGGSADEEWKAA
jgi:uncharacterized damage-inducible protein DinB